MVKFTANMDLSLSTKELQVYFWGILWAGCCFPIRYAQAANSGPKDSRSQNIAKMNTKWVEVIVGLNSVLEQEKDQICYGGLGKMS